MFKATLCLSSGGQLY